MVMLRRIITFAVLTQPSLGSFVTISFHTSGALVFKADLKLLLKTTYTITNLTLDTEYKVRKRLKPLYEIGRQTILSDAGCIHTFSIYMKYNILNITLFILLIIP